MKLSVEAPSWELMSINQFEELAQRNRLNDADTFDICFALSLVYEAETLPKQLDSLIDLINKLTHSTENPATESLHDQCRQILRLMLRGPTEETLQKAIENQSKSDKKLKQLEKKEYRQLLDAELQKLLNHRAKRVSFKPDFVHDAPKKAPLRQLLDDLVDWNNESDHEIKREKLHKIIRTSSVKTTKIFKPKISSKLTRERRIFISLSIAHLLKHLVVNGTTKLATEPYQETDLLRQAKIYSDKEREEKRLLPFDGCFYQLKSLGNDRDRCFTAFPFSTKTMSAHGSHEGEALLVVTTSGDFFVDSTVDSTEPGQSVFHSALDRNPFFAGRIATDKKGKLILYDNHTGHFLHNENNVLNVTQYFYELGLLTEETLATLVMQRNVPSDEEQLTSYISRLPGFTDQKNLSESVPITQRFIDNLKSDPVNVRGFLVTKSGEPIDRKANPLPAKDNKNSGIRNDFEKMGVNPVGKKGIQELEEIREKIRLKSRLNRQKLRFRFASERPDDLQAKSGTIVFYPSCSTKTSCNYVLRLNKKFIYTGTIEYAAFHKAVTQVLTKLKTALIPNSDPVSFESNESSLLVQAALNLSTVEKCLMRPFHSLFRHRFPKKSPALLGLEVEPKKTTQAADLLSEISQNISRDAYNAFLEELSYHDKTHHLLDPQLQANNLFFGKMCLFRTNKSTDNTTFDPEKKGQHHIRFMQPLHEINHFKRKEKSSSPQKQLGQQSTEVEVVEDDDFAGSMNLERQNTFYGNK